MKRIQVLFVIFLIIVFLAGIWVILTPPSKIETMDNKDTTADTGCPDLLVQKGDRLLLYNTKKPEDDTNPIPFLNLDEYIFYLDQQRKDGNSCPVLYLQQENNAQGQDVYRIRPGPFDKQGGLPPISNLNDQPAKQGIPRMVDSSREHPPYNNNNYSGFDPTSQYVGVYTTLDVLHDSTKKQGLSDNPMDPNWGGVEVTNQSIQSGKYEDNNIFKPMLYQPKMAFIPISNPDMGHPKDIY
jgi:hypothetical protein